MAVRGRAVLAQRPVPDPPGADSEDAIAMVPPWSGDR
jgi:hypothetical protein